MINGTDLVTSFVEETLLRDFFLLLALPSTGGSGWNQVVTCVYPIIVRKGLMILVGFYYGF